MSKRLCPSKWYLCQLLNGCQLFAMFSQEHQQVSSLCGWVLLVQSKVLTMPSSMHSLPKIKCLYSLLRRILYDSDRKWWVRKVLSMRPEVQDLRRSFISMPQLYRWERWTDRLSKMYQQGKSISLIQNRYFYSAILISCHRNKIWFGRLYWIRFWKQNWIGTSKNHKKRVNSYKCANCQTWKFEHQCCIGKCQNFSFFNQSNGWNRFDLGWKGPNLWP